MQRSSVRSTAAQSRLSADTAPLRPDDISSLSLPESDPDDNKYGEERPSSSRTNALLHSLGWLTAAALLIYYTQLLPTLLHDNRIQHGALYCGAAALLASASAFLHLAFVVPRRSPGSSDLYALSPHSVHLSLLSGLAAYGCWCVALWPVYGLLAPVMLFVLAMAAVLSTNWLPV